MSNVTAVTYLVREYDEARSWFCEVLDFHVVEDLDLGGASRWLTVSAEHGPRLVLAVAKNDEERAQIGRASGGRVAFFLTCEDTRTRYRELCARGVTFDEEPRLEPWGWVAVFRDLYGNRWDLLEESPEATAVVVRRHFGALNDHDPEAFFATLSDDILWATGADVFSGRDQVRELFDDGFWTWRPQLTVLSLLADGELAMAEVHETLHLPEGPLDFRLAVSFRVENGRVTVLKAYREGVADI